METPPLTRGRRNCGLGREHGIGNTPAYAGKTGRREDGRHDHGKHPRLRGEDLYSPSGVSPILETPPLTRGRRLSERHRQLAAGNTPAYAGKTSRSVSGITRPKKHPRLRGEDSPLRWRSKGSTETPPLTRGRLAENSTIYVLPSETPPLTRGRQRVSRIGNALSGNTPAYAGKTNRIAQFPLTARNTPAYAGKT